MLAVEDGVAANEGIFDLPVAVEGAVWDAVNEGDGGAEAVAFEVLQVVVEDLVVLADDTYATGLFLFVAEEEVLFDDAAVAVAKGEGAGDFEEGVGAVDIATGLVGDAFGLAVALVEEVFFDETGGFLHGGFAVANAEGFTAVFAETGAGAEVVVMNVMPAGIWVAEPDNGGGAFVFFAFDAAVIELV